jgi:hypothetical protein
MDPYVYALSAVVNNLTVCLSSVNEQLTAIPNNPYLATKFMLFGNDYKFPTLDDINVPEEITTEGLIAKLEEIQNQHQCRIIDCITNPQDYDFNLTEPAQIANQLSILAELSGDSKSNNYVVTQDKFKNYIEFIELVNSVDDSQMTEETSQETIKKIGYFYTTLLAKKTI